jgi:hypothetical protein
LDLHWVPATYRSLAQISINEELPAGAKKATKTPGKEGFGLHSVMISSIGGRCGKGRLWLSLYSLSYMPSIAAAEAVVSVGSMHNVLCCPSHVGNRPVTELG